MRRLSSLGALTLVLLHAFGAAAAPTPSGLEAALAGYARLADDGPERREAAAWRRTAAALEGAVRRAPRSREAPDALYRAGLSLEKAQALSRAAERAEDRRRAAAVYEQIISGFPKSRAAPDALLRLGRIREFSGDEEGARSCYGRILSDYLDAPGVPLARKRLGEVGRGAELRGVRAFSGPGYTRVVMDLSAGAPFEPGFLREEAGRPPRIFVDLAKTGLAPGCEPALRVADGLVRQVRCGRFSPTTVRVVLDLEGAASFRAFALEAPSRLVVDVFHPGDDEQPGKPRRGGEEPSPGTPSFPVRKLRIVIDPGHGGHDPGAIGPGNVQEKDVVLALGKELARRLRDRLGCEVKLTRSDDRFLSLEERTAVANAFGADLFLSVHANASRSAAANGIETYFLERSSDRAARRLAGRENATGEDALSGIEHALADLLLGSKVRESERLARSVQNGLVASIQKHYPPVRDLGVKRAPFYVLTGAMMPAVLVETAFISNPVECKRLCDPRYRDRAVEGVADGVVAYVRATERVGTTEGKRTRSVF